MKKILQTLFILISFVNISYSQVDSLHCHTEGNASLNCYYEINHHINQGTCFNFNPKIQVAVIDSCSFTPWDNDSCVRYFGQGNYWAPCTGTFTCLNQPLPWFQFELNDAVQVDSLISMLNNKIPYGYHLLAYTFSVYNYSSLPQYNAFRNAFINLGSVMMSTLPDTVPFIFYVKKGFPGSVAEIFGNTASDTIDLYVKMPCSTTGVNEIENSYPAVSLFPNPATNQLTISSRQWAIKEIEIYDVMGQIVKSHQPLANSQRQITVDVSELTTGIYFVRVRGEKATSVVKMVKE